MRIRQRTFVIAIFTMMVSLSGCTQPSQNIAPDQLREITLLYTNDFESAYDPIPAF